MGYKVAPDEIEDGGFSRTRLGPGKYMLVLQKVVSKDDYTLLILTDPLGRGEAVESIRWEDPAEGIPEHPGLWRRAVAALDIPSEDFWNANPREEHEWFKQDFEDAVGRPVYAEIKEIAGKGKHEGKTFLNIVDFKSPRRYPHLEGEVDEYEPDKEIPF